MYVVGRQRRHLEARFFSSSGGCVWRAGSRASVSVGTLRLWIFPLLVFLYGMYIVGRQRRYLDAGVFSASGCFVWRAPSRAST